MLKLLFTFFILITNFIFGTPSFVLEYHQMSSKKEELAFIKKYENSKHVDIQAYVISTKMKQAQYAFFPWKKLVIFNREKKKLEVLLKKYPNNVHLRYIRLLIQEKTPKILNYSLHINEDKVFLNSLLQKKDSTDYLDKYIKKNTSL